MRVAAVLVVIWLLSPTTAWGQSEADAGSPAVQLRQQGLAAYELGRWEEAYQRFEAAEQLAHSSTHIIFMARALRNTGKLVAARKLYGAVASETLAAEPAAEARQAQSAARSELAALDERIPTLTVRVQGASGQVDITVDGSAAMAGAAVQLDPGEHLVLVRRAGAVVARRHIRLKPSDRQDIMLSLARQGQGDEKPEGPSRGWISLVIVGSVLVAGGIGTGIAAAVIDADLDDRCGDGACHPQLDQEVKNFHVLGYVSTGALAAGAPLLGIGVAWRLFLYDDSQVEPTVSLTPGGLQVGGRF